MSFNLIASLESQANHHYSSQDTLGSVPLPALPLWTAWIQNLGARSTQLIVAIFFIEKKKKKNQR